MRQSTLFTKTRKEAPKDEVSKNAQLLIRAGYIHKEMAGVYSLLPLGLRVINKIADIIREEMNALGGQEIEMTTLQDKKLWEQAGKWNDEQVDVWFKTQLKNGSELGLAFSHEEAIAEMLKNHVSSYKDLPKYLYQIQTKFRNELRSKSGMMRGREFLMKDMYSFNRSSEELHAFYEEAKQAYVKIFERVGLGDYTYVTSADGSVFGDSSHEFQTLSEAGEDTIYVDLDKRVAINKEVYTDEKLAELGLSKESLVEKRAIEVGNIFPIEDKVARTMNFTFKDEEGNNQSVIMGSYGIGLGRVMGTVVEVLSDEKGIVWPKAIAPFDVHLVMVNSQKSEVSRAAEALYQELQQRGASVLYDDRDARPGQKFADSDLIGIPLRVVISEKTLEGGKLEVKERTGEAHLIEPDTLFDLI